RPCDLPLSGADPDGQVSFVALLVDDDQSRTTGIVAVAGALPGEAAGIVQPLADRLGGEPVALTAQRRTRRGARQGRGARPPGPPDGLRPGSFVPGPGPLAGYPAASSAKCAASPPTGTAACSPEAMSRTVTVPASSSALP